LEHHKKKKRVDGVYGKEENRKMMKLSDLTEEDNGRPHRGEKKIIHLAVSGRLTDKNKNKLTELVDKKTEELNSGILLLDFSELIYISRQAIGDIFKLAKELSKKGWQTSLTNVPPQIAEIIEIGGLLPGIGSDPIFESAKMADNYVEEIESTKDNTASPEGLKTIFLKC
jgi:anti-anti-sigma factor